MTRPPKAPVSAAGLALQGAALLAALFWGLARLGPPARVTTRDLWRHRERRAGRRVRATGVFVFDELHGGVLGSPVLTPAATAPGP